MNLQKFTLKAWLDPPSMKMFAPAQKMRSLSAGDDDRAHLGMLEADALIASASSMSTPRS